MPKKADEAERIVAAAMRLAAERGWRAVSLSAVAEAAGMPLAKLHDRFDGKAALLGGLSRIADAAALADAGSWTEEDRTRDRLFEVLMRRFEALRPYRDGISAVLRESGGDPLTACAGWRSLARSMGWMLEAAGLSSAGIAGAIRARGLAAVYLATFPAWLRDESEDLSRTMAALDRNLRRAESLAATFGDRRRQDSPPEGAGTTEGIA